ncbi:MarR family winged helix-turn-helix transcriptional regulator [Microbacterium azadirachtae]|uniref:MarR family winged helix-turn-helix transcriptional regulator n=1 Tax=Microbacterium azadirachtae TaxID=582680 RepID=UPI0008819AC2|nr:MarR family transcriptional regulator [Microbacterium azadirachtae]SDM15799.1 DNA-binding transcriptional regulator, MarR family [Microbacterium azadirachtae]SEG39253.1 DNA-binding transcriptional regulator, MarR family [Microbacterium azadirachtae]SEG42299.1 DNA-binding transcriptional regulator, MarR family [Microbacterium azadirachtae]
MDDERLHETASELRLATFRLARRLRSVRAVDSRNTAMSDAQLAVLAALRAHGRHSLTALADRERVTAPTMSAVVTGLEEQGYVTRIPDDQDRRRVHVEITAAGEKVVTETFERRTRLIMTEITELDLTGDELRVLHEASILMRKLAEL